MSNQKPTIPKGTRDFGPEEVQKRRYIMNTIESIFKKYGFMPIETPTMENLTTLEGKYGDEGDKLLFRVLNSGDYLGDLKSYNDRILADESQDKTFLPSPSGKLNDLDSKATLPFIAEKGLRYDLTVPFARYVVMNRNEINFPFRRYQIQPVWRADRPQKGRYREFWQCDADVVGSDSLLNEVDLIRIYDEVFRKLRITNYEIRINNRKILAGIAEVVKSKESLTTISTGIDKLDKIGENGVRVELGRHGFTSEELDLLFGILSIKGENKSTLSKLKQKMGASVEGLAGINELEFAIRILEEGGSDIHLQVDFSLARGLSYYTGCILEVASNEGSLKSSIGGGGRYDNLTGNFGLPGVSGVGISFGLDRIYDVMEELKLFPADLRATTTRVLFCYFDETSQAYALSCLKKLREAGISAEIYPDLPTNKKPLEKPMKYATALQIPYAAVVHNENKIVLKFLTENTEKELTPDQIIDMVK